jgi:tetratricopeptide (TPR) repeat protein
MRVTPIGSCRVVHSLRRAARVHPLEVNLDGVYGYTHTGAEALQLVRFMFEGEAPGPPALLPVICRSADALDRAEPHELSDLYVVELSSAKVISVGTSVLQSNYLKVHFSEFFADKLRSSHFWTLVREERKAQLSSWLQRQPAFLGMTPADRKMLAAITVHSVTYDELESQMRALVERLPRVVFVTHCNARLESGDPLASRSELISFAKRIGSSIGCQVYDPTFLMEAVGQARAIKEDSLSLAHYTPIFERLLYEDWVGLFGLPHARDTVGGLEGDDVAGDLGLDESSGAEEGPPDALKARTDTALAEGTLRACAEAVCRLANEQPREAYEIASRLADEWCDPLDDDTALHFDDVRARLEGLHTLGALCSKARSVCQRIERRQRVLARDALRRKEFGEAIRRGQLALAAGSQDVRLFAFVARAHHAQGDYAVARQLLERAASIIPDDPIVWLLRGRASLRMDDLPDASNCFQWVRTLPDSKPRAVEEAERHLATIPGQLVAKAEHLLVNGDLDQAWRFASAALTATEAKKRASEIRDEIVTRLRQNLREEQDHPSACVRLSLQILEKDPADTYAQRSLARALTSLERYEEAEAAWKRLLVVQPDAPNAARQIEQCRRSVVELASTGRRSGVPRRAVSI